MRFSVVTITKNNPDGFKRTKQSVQSQIFKGYEWIVIDGDKEPDNGIYDAMNKGVERAQGDYTIFMNAGDAFADDTILSEIAKYDADFIYADSIEGGQVKKSKPISKMKNGMVTHHQAMVYRTAILKKLRYDEQYSLAADYKLTLEFIKLSHSIYCINKPLCIFEQGGVSQVNAATARHQEIEIRKELGISAPLTPYRQWLAQWVKMRMPWLYLTCVQAQD